MCKHSLAEQDTEVADGSCPICLRVKLEKAERVIKVQHSALQAVSHDRPSAHTDGVWLLMTQAIDEGEKWKQAQ